MLTMCLSNATRTQAPHIPKMMSFFDEHGELQLEAGAFRLEVSGCSPGKRGLELGAPAPVTALFRVLEAE